MRWLAIVGLAGVMVGSPAYAQDTGKVNYFGTGGARLYIDGTYAGKLPMSAELAAGTHTFRVEPPYSEAYEITRDVQFNGQLSIDLPMSADEPPPVEEETEETSEAGAEESAGEPVMVPIKLYAPFEAIIFYNGQELGESPVALTIPEGDYSFIVVNEDGTTFTSMHEVKANGGSTQSLTLEP